MQKEHSIDIDIKLDFLIAETILLHQQKNKARSLKVYPKVQINRDRGGE